MFRIWSESIVDINFPSRRDNCALIALVVQQRYASVRNETGAPYHLLSVEILGEISRGSALEGRLASVVTVVKAQARNRSDAQMSKGHSKTLHLYGNM